MTHYHRNTAAGDQVTSMIDEGTKTPITLTFDSVKDDFAALQKSLPGIVEAGVIGQSEQGADIQALRIGKNYDMPILICGCHHAREWISVEVPLLFAKLLVNNYKTDKKIQRIVDSIELWVIPIVNPDGHERSVLKNRMWRKNFPTDKARASVDINRNYETSTWKMKKGVFSDKPADDTYRGPSAGFAKEAVAMQNFIRLKKFKGVVSYHSAGRFVLFPWAGKAVPPPDSKEDEMATTLKTIVDSKGAAKGITYTKLQSSSLYPTLWGIPAERGLMPGEFLDFVLETLPDCIGITIELEPGSDDPRSFVLPEDEIEPTFDLHRASMLAFVNCITTIRKPPASVSLKLQKPGIPSPLVVYQPECSKVFESY